MCPFACVGVRRLQWTPGHGRERKNEKYGKCNPILTETLFYTVVVSAVESRRPKGQEGPIAGSGAGEER